jgi:serine/threonine protein kinase/Tfp pilus assembly protein PilF
MRLNAGDRLGPYEILGPLGAGGMGEVFRARDSRLGREVAIKILPEEISENPSALNQFKREAKTLASLSHPNIVTIYEFELHNNIPFAVMELLPGESLRRTIARSALPWREAAAIAAAIADGLAAAHSKGVIHRDLKPENIFLTPDRSVKILDFGLARFHPAASSQELTSAPTQSRMTETGIVKGTVPYMSPEQVRGSPVDERSDIFSLGCVLYEMLSARRTFSQATSADTMAAILKDDPPDLIESGIHIPSELNHIVQRCLRKDSNQRFQTARDLAFALHEIAETRRVEPAKLPKPRRTFLPTFLVVGLSILVIAAFLIGFNISGWRERIWGTGAGTIRSLAVLPLNNLSGDPKQEYFADGMTEELISKLALIESLRVISRTSVMEYKGAHKPLPQIAKELNVDAIIEGSVMQIGNQVKITAQLVDAHSDRHLWAQAYQRDIRDVFALQNEVALAIADQIKLKLSPQQQTQFAGARPVQPDAYQAYLRGLEFMRRPERSKEDFRQAEQLFQRAVEIDPDFAIAYAELAKTHAWTYQFHDHTPERLAMAKAAVDQAFQLQPDLPEAHHALGYYYYFGFYDYDKAIKEYETAQKYLSGNANLLENLAAVSRRQGKFEEAVEYEKKALALSPRDSGIPFDLAACYIRLRRYSEADRYFDLAISLAPDNVSAYEGKTRNWILWKGDIKGARAILDKRPSKDLVDAYRIWLDVLERNYDSAFKGLSGLKREGEEEIVRLEWIATVYYLKNDLKRAAATMDLPRAYWQRLLEKNNDAVQESWIRSSLGYDYAISGRKADAIREGKKGVELWPVSRDAFWGPDTLWKLIQIYVITGEYDEAIDQIEYLLTIPSELSVQWFRLDPLMDPLRNHPRFQKLLKTS